MTIFEALAHSTSDFLLAADSVREASIPWDEAKVHEAVIAFWHAMRTSAIRSAKQRDDVLAAENDVLKKLTAAAGGNSEASPIASTRRYCNALRDVLFPIIKLEWLNDRRRGMGDYFQQQLAHGAAKVGNFVPLTTQPTWEWRLPQPEAADVDTAIAKLRGNEGKAWLNQARRDPQEWRQRMFDEAADVETRLRTRFAVEAAEAPATDPTAQAPQTDGPQPPNLFWWNGEGVEIGGKGWSVLNYLWHRTNRTAETLKLCVVVWDDEEAASGKLRGVRARLNTLFLKQGIPFELSVSHAHITLKGPFSARRDERT